jgi:predicted transcriptional regulator
MTLFLECSQPQGGRAVLLSIKPKYSDLILSREKCVEFRRTWAREEVGLVVVYASSPQQRLVATVRVQEVIHASPSKLWEYCRNHGGGLTKKELFEYFSGKPKGYAVMLGKVKKMKKPIDPESIMENFSPPQSFRYLTERELKAIEAINS